MPALPWSGAARRETIIVRIGGPVELKAPRLRCVSGPRETGGRGRNGPPPTVTASSNSVLALQRAIGNRAVTGLVGRDPSSERRPDRDPRATAVVLQRAGA